MTKQYYLIIFLLIISSICRAQQINVSGNLKQSSDSSDNIFSLVEYEAEFPGGLTGWSEYLQKHLKADIPIRKGAPNGTYKVIVRFIVSKNGKISNVIPETNFGYGMEEEVIRVIKNGPKWIPAQQNGRKVNAYRKQPVMFVVSD